MNKSGFVRTLPGGRLTREEPRRGGVSEESATCDWGVKSKECG
jgi:hypothetical protein